MVKFTDCGSVWIRLLLRMTLAQQWAHPTQVDEVFDPVSLEFLGFRFPLL